MNNNLVTALSCFGALFATKPPASGLNIIGATCFLQILAPFCNQWSNLWSTSMCKSGKSNLYSICKRSFFHSSQKLCLLFWSISYIFHPWELIYIETTFSAAQFSAAGLHSKEGAGQRMKPKMVSMVDTWNNLIHGTCCTEFFFLKSSFKCNHKSPCKIFGILTHLRTMKPSKIQAVSFCIWI